VIRDLGRLTGREWSGAEAINDRGQVVGYSYRLQSDGVDEWCVAARAFLWQQGKMIDVAPLGADTCGATLHINERGQVIGEREYRNSTGTGSRFRAFVWEKGKLVLLPELPGGTRSSVTAINDRGQIVGSVEIAKQRRHAVLWTFKP
jgi:probable HAF family extracellular repeat protein